MHTIVQRQSPLKTIDMRARGLDFGEGTIEDRFRALLSEPEIGREEEFWDSLKPRMLAGLQRTIEEWLSIETALAVGGAPYYDALHAPKRIHVPETTNKFGADPAIVGSQGS